MNNPKENYEVKNDEVQIWLKKIGEIIRKGLPKGWGFTLFMFSYGKDGSMFYLSSASRQDMIKAMMEFLDKTSESKN